MQKKIAFVAMALGIMVVAAVLIAIKFQAVDEKKAEAASKEIEESYKAKFPRWVFNDSSIPEEAAYKAGTLAKIDTFWREFEKNKDSLNPNIGKKTSETVPPFMKKYLSDINPYIMWELKVDPNDESITNFTITAESEPALRPILKTMVERAPKLKEWRFVNYLPPFKANEIFDGLKTKDNFKLTAYETKCEISPKNKIDITIYSPDFEDSEEASANGYRLAELVLGEENAERWAGRFRSVKRAVTKDEKTASIEFSKGFNALKQTILANLPDKPYFNYDWQQRPKYFYVVPNPKNPKTSVDINKCIDSPLFYSDRYSKCGDKFCYLVTGEKWGFKTENDIIPLLDQMDKTLVDAKCGITWAHNLTIGKNGECHFSVDMCINDIPKAVPILKKLVAEHKVTRNTFLIFHDADWRFEWISLTDDKEAPLFRNGED